jgi:hypothetical protein
VFAKATAFSRHVRAVASLALPIRSYLAKMLIGQRDTVGRDCCAEKCIRHPKLARQTR